MELEIDSDSDLPTPLNTPAKQKKRAKLLAEAHTGRTVARVKSCQNQGSFSRTLLVSFAGRAAAARDPLVIQFRTTAPGVECFAQARAVFGDLVPTITPLREEELEALGIQTFAMSFVPGTCWFSFEENKDARVPIARSLGAVLSRGYVDGSAAAVVDTYLLPTLQSFFASLNDRSEDDRGRILLQPHVERLIVACERLKRFPLYLSHHDLYWMNILIDPDTCEVSGIVDWEKAMALPFGVGLYCVTDAIACGNEKNRVYIPPGAPDAERAFWDAVLHEAPAIVRENLEDVQSAVHLGSLLYTTKDGGLRPQTSEGINIGRAPVEEWLAARLSYRLPMLRGRNEPAFPEEFIVGNDDAQARPA